MKALLFLLSAALVACGCSTTKTMPNYPAIIPTNGTGTSENVEVGFDDLAALYWQYSGFTLSFSFDYDNGIFSGTVSCLLTPDDFEFMGENGPVVFGGNLPLIAVDKYIDQYTMVQSEQSAAVVAPPLGGSPTTGAAYILMSPYVTVAGVPRATITGTCSYAVDGAGEVGTVSFSTAGGGIMSYEIPGTSISLGVNLDGSLGYVLSNLTFSLTFLP